MEFLSLFDFGAEQLTDLIQYVSATSIVVGVFNVVSWLLNRRLATIYAISADDPRNPRKKIAQVAAKFLSRAEVNGVISQRARGGVRLDFTHSKFDYKFRREIEIALPKESYDAIVVT